MDIKSFEVNGRQFGATPTAQNSRILRTLDKRKAEHAALLEAADSMEEAVRCALDYMPVGSAVPEWLVRLDHAAKQARAALNNS